MKIKIIKKRSKKKKLRKNLMLAGLSVALLSQPVMAEAKKWTFHEGKWKETKAYGRTIISEDSAREWGPWTEFVQPAAGPTPVAALPQVTIDGPSYFRPESANEYSPKYTLPVPPPVSGEWQGYAAYQSSDYGYGEGYYENEYGPYPGRIALRLSPNDPNTVTVDGGAGEGIVSYRITNLDGAPVYQSGDIGAEFYDGLSEFDANAQTYDESSYSYESIDGYPPYNTETWDPIPGGQVTAGWFWTWNESYDGYYGYDGGEGWGVFVAGISTPLSDIANLQAGNVTADYYGRTFDGWTPVHIQVNFGPGTWSGSWNEGADGYTSTYTDSNGTKYVRGEVGFNAEGTINGANIQSTSVSAGDGTVSGQVQGNFFGNNADVLGGVADITKTTEGYDNAKHVDVFITCKGTECGPYD